MKALLVSVAVVLLLGTAIAPAEAFSLYPPGGDLQDLPHGRYYTWGINANLPEGYRVVSASVTFHQIWNWAIEANDRIWFSLLQDAPSGVRWGRDRQAYGNWFDSPEYSGEHTLLAEFDNLPELWENREDVTYEFTESDLAVLNDYITDGNFGLGFDPDCHFYNCGVEFHGAIAPIPEPTTLVLFGLGLIGLGGARKRWARKS